VVETKLIWITLLVKLGVAAAVSSALARSSAFRRLLFAERRTTAQTLGLLAMICVPLSLGVWVRIVVHNFYAADISFETAILLGVLLGPTAAAEGACLLALPAVLHGEYLALPFDVGVAIIGGIFSWFVEREEIWSFSPFIDLSIYQWIRRNLRKPRFDRQILLMILIVSLEIVRWWLARTYPHRLFALPERSWAIAIAVWACSTMVVGIPLKIWNAVRIEQTLKEQTRLLLEARLDALQRQINPHFLFNTLNSIASLVRRDPERARELIVKLANILRALLKDHDSYVPFREELNFTEDYLGIEVVRFGTEKLKVVKEIDPQTLELPVPSMLMQPLVENSIKHGLEPRIHGGTITLRSRLQEGRFIIEVEDDGVGMTASSQRVPAMRTGNGIGMRNVRERLEVLFGGNARFNVVSRPGRGTRVTLEMPVDVESSQPARLDELPVRPITST
jgi:two-component system LytT family sensor kinase